MEDKNFKGEEQKSSSGIGTESSRPAQQSFVEKYGISDRDLEELSKIAPPIQSEVVGCSIDRPLHLRPITDDDLTKASNESYQHGRRHGKEELADEIEILIYWLLRCYQSGHREGWEKGATTQETMDALLHVLAERGYDPSLDSAAMDLIARMEKR